MLLKARWEQAPAPVCGLTVFAKQATKYGHQALRALRAPPLDCPFRAHIPPRHIELDAMRPSNPDAQARLALSYQVCLARMLLTVTNSRATAINVDMEESR
jgi:hypothetical protein